jgi:hypothetical protein
MSQEHHLKRAALRTHLAEGAAQALRGEFVEDFSVKKLLNEIEAEDRAGSFAAKTPPAPAPHRRSGRRRPNAPG